jgi:hypothetical protein
MTIAIIGVAWLTVLVGFVCLRLWVTRRRKKDYAARVGRANKSPRERKVGHPADHVRERVVVVTTRLPTSGMPGFELVRSYGDRVAVAIDQGRQLRGNRVLSEQAVCYSREQSSRLSRV